MVLDKSIKQNKVQILNLWLKKFTDTYPDESARFFKDNPGQFNNPVGYTFRVNMEKMFDELLQDNDHEKMRQYLDGIVRIRAVQGFDPATALGFMPLLRESIWEVCGREIEADKLHEQWLDLIYRMDRLTYLAFDIYMACREQLWKQRSEMFHHRTHKLLERAIAKNAAE
ncbi:RsbRD N-terminal domain-containing protein [Desulfonatronospira sp.]|uniref:RsbRD N-terminal domain-containing protein n=1 Tax=Desulfonatronospira sp. TaxID=1962951 RepID=UPI0025B95C0F|nr:RsbRD N-terminal domain-containing protein [Desulfonatronospira sp.]